MIFIVPEIGDHPRPVSHGAASGRRGLLRLWPGAGRLIISAVLGLLAGVPAACVAAISPDEEVVFIPSVGSQSGPHGAWEVDFHGWVFERESRDLSLLAFREVLGLDKDELSPDELQVFKDRARWFLVDNERNKPLSVRFDQQLVSLGKTGADGQLRAKLALPDEQVSSLLKKSGGPFISFTIADSKAGITSNRGEVHILHNEGLSVISDIDDTIKVSDVHDQRTLLRNTFTKPFVPVDGMARVYRSWLKNNASRFHYVSASPIQLYVPLAGFLSESGFPSGTFHLKPFRWKDEQFFNLFVSPEEYKPGVIEPLLKRFPSRKFVLVGDAGEKDPEIFGDIARRYPRQVVRVFIRELPGRQQDAERYARAFDGVQANKWQLFRLAGELPIQLP
jgi:hypothetical protein